MEVDTIKGYRIVVSKENRNVECIISTLERIIFNLKDIEGELIIEVKVEE